MIRKCTKFLAVLALMALVISLISVPAYTLKGAVISDVKVLDKSGDMKLEVKADAAVKYRVTQMSDPRQALVLELFPAVLAPSVEKDIEVNRGLVEKVRIRQFSKNPDLVRVVVDLISPVMYKVTNAPENKGLVLTLDTTGIAKPVAKVIEQPAPKPVAKPAPVAVEKPKPVAKPAPVAVEKPKPVAKPAPVVVEKPKPVVKVEPVEKPAPKPVAKPAPAPKPAPKPVVIEDKSTVKVTESTAKFVPLTPVSVEKPQKAEVATPAPQPVVIAKPAPQPEVVQEKLVPTKIVVHDSDKANFVPVKPKIKIEKKDKLVTLDFVNADLVYVLKLLAKELNLNLVLDPSVKGDVTIALKDVTPAAALGLILKLTGYENKQVDHTLIVGSQALINKIPDNIMQSKTESTKMVRQIIPLENAKADAVIAQLKAIYPDAKLVSDSRINAVMATADVNTIKEIKGLIAQLDIPAGATSEEMPVKTEMIQLKFSTGGTVANQAKSVLGSKMPEVLVDERLNALVITGTEDKIQALKDFLVNLESAKMTQLVRLDIKVVDLSTTGSKTLGMVWGSSPQVTQPGQTSSSQGVLAGTWLGGLTEQVKDNALQNGQLGFNYSYFTRDAYTLKNTLNLVINKGEGRVVASPTVTTVSGKEAIIKVGETYPYAYQDPRSGQWQVQNIEYLTKVTVKPTVTNSDYSLTDPDMVKLNLDCEVNDQKGAETTLGIPIKATKAVKIEEITLKDGETLVVGGLMGSQEQKNVSKVPLLGDIPLVGKMFTNTSTSKVNREVVIMVTPTILRDKK